MSTSGRRAAVVVLVMVLVALTTGWREDTAGMRGAAHRLRFEATGYFHTERQRGRWWLVTPDGRPFYSRGINHVTSTPDTDRQTGRCPYCDALAARYPGPDLVAWTDATVDRLRGWGFNTIGAWSDVDRFATRTPYTELLNMADGDDWFAPAFEERARSIAETSVRPRRHDPNLVGWFLDNELHWGPDWRRQQPLLDDYLTLPEGAPGRAVAERFRGDPGGFVQALAERYFQVTTSVVHAADPHHLILGTRMVSWLMPPEVVEVAGRYLDVLSVNHYALIPGLPEFIESSPLGPFVPVADNLAAFHRLSGLPVMITEYTFRAADSGLPNSWPPIFPTLATQQDRADAHHELVSSLYRTPWIVGDHWFEYVDEPPGGRFDGEDSNFGLVTTDDTPWSTLTASMTLTHAQSPDRLADPRARCLSWHRDRHHHVRCTERSRLPPRHGH